jgi:hypothetical protein
MAGNGREYPGMAGNGREWPGMAGNGLKPLLNLQTHLQIIGQPLISHDNPQTVLLATFPVFVMCLFLFFKVCMVLCTFVGESTSHVPSMAPDMKNTHLTF